MSMAWNGAEEWLGDPDYWRRRARLAERQAAQTSDLRQWLTLQAQAQEFEQAAQAAEQWRRRGGAPVIARWARR